MRPSLFSREAIETVRRLYPDVVAIQSAHPGLDAKQIQRKAWKLGVAAEARTKPFTDAEDAVLFRLYPDVGAILSELPNRDRGQIERRAWRIKATKGPGPFKAAEDAVIREHFPDVAAICAALPARTEQSLLQRAARLGLRRQAGQHRRYRQGELRLLRIHYPNYDLLCALLAPRSRDAIKRQASVLGLTFGFHGTRTGISRPWTQEELEAAKVYGQPIEGRTAAAIDRVRYRNRFTASGSVSAEKRLELIQAREAMVAQRRAERRAKSEALRPQREAAARDRRNARKRKDRALKAAARRCANDRTVAQAMIQRAAAPPRASRPAAPKPAKAHAAIRRQARPAGSIDPRVLSAAGRSRYGIELVSVVQRAVPSDVWPHVKPLVIEGVTMAVVEGRCTLEGIPALLPAAIKAVMAEQFGGHVNGP